MFEQVIDPELALKEVEAFLDRKKIYPKRRATLQGAVDTIAEAIQYGQVTIAEDGAITQELLDPIVDDKGNAVLSKISYSARIAPSIMASKIAALKSQTMEDKLLCHTMAYSGQAAGIINKLESTDRNTCDAISLFFMV